MSISMAKELKRLTTYVVYLCQTVPF